MTVDTLIVIAKEPRPGRVKTRLITPDLISPSQSAALAEASLHDTLDALSDHPCRRRILLLDGQPPRWLGSDWEVIPQCSGDLDQRLSVGISSTAPGSVLLVGMDTPQLTTELVAPWSPTDDRQACLGPASDGGFWAIGFGDAAMAARVIPGVPMSHAHTGAVQLERLHHAGLEVTMLPELTDVDTAQSAAQVGAECPDTRFAHLWQEMTAMHSHVERAS